MGTNHNALPPHAQLVIMTALCAADLKEKNDPVSFENTVNNIFECNDMPKIKFPQGFSLNLKITMANMLNMTDAPQEQPQEGNNMEIEQTRLPKRKDMSQTEE